MPLRQEDVRFWKTSSRRATCQAATLTVRQARRRACGSLEPLLKLRQDPPCVSANFARRAARLATCSETAALRRFQTPDACARASFEAHRAATCQDVPRDLTSLCQVARHVLARFPQPRTPAKIPSAHTQRSMASTRHAWRALKRYRCRAVCLKVGTRARVWRLEASRRGRLETRCKMRGASRKVGRDTRRVLT